MSNTDKQVSVAYRLRIALQEVDDSDFGKGELNGLSSLLRWCNRVIREAEES